MGASQQDPIGGDVPSLSEVDVSRLQAVVRMGQQAITTDDTPGFMNMAVQAVSQILDTELCGILQLLPGGDGLRLVAGVGWQEGLVGHATFSAGGQSQAGYALLSGEPVIVSDLPTEPRFSGPSLLSDHGVVSGMSVVIHGREQAYGVLGAHTTRRRQFTKDDVLVLQQVANVLAGFVKYQQLEDSARKSESELRSVLDLPAGRGAEAAGLELAAIIEGADDAIWAIGRDGTITAWNPGAERLYEYSAKEVVGKLPPHIPPDRLEEILVLRERVWAGERVPAFETVRMKKDGRLIDVAMSLSPVWDRTGQVVAISMIAHDITNLKKAEKDLLLRDRAIRAVASGILIADHNQPDTPVVYASPGFERLTGYSPEEVIGKNCRFLHGKETDPNVVAQIRQAIQDGKHCDVELLNYRKDGTPFWNQLSLSPVHSQTGRITHYVGVQSDVSERRRLEMQFRQAQKMESVGKLAGGVAHDFNNLLTIINGYSDLILERLQPDDPMRELMAQINKAGQRAGTLTRQLLMFSRQSVLEPKVLDINGAVTNTQTMLGRLIGEDITLTTVLEPHLAPVKVDPGQLEQALLNLAVNARDAMPQGGKLTVETHAVELTEEQCLGQPGGKPGRYSMVAVTDNGVGMDQATTARIFEPFFTTKETGKGTGLGLAMVYGFVKSSGGYISVYSEPGHGTTFKVYFPEIQEPVSSAQSLPGDTKPRGGNETVLLVEDDDGVRALTRHVLQKLGYTVLAASNGSDAILLAQEHQGTIHLLVTDVVMPHMGGRQVAERVEQIRPGIKVLFCSGYTDDAVVRHGVLESHVAFIQKPYSAALLAHKVRDVLDDRA